MITVVRGTEAARRPQPLCLPAILICLVSFALPWIAAANTPRPALVTLSGLVQAYDGGPKTVTATTEPLGLPVTLIYNGSPTAPSDSGSYTVIGTIADPRFIGTAKDTLTIAPAITNVAIPSAGTYQAGQIFSFMVAFNVPIFVRTNLGVPTLPLTIGTNTLTAAFSGAASNTISFRCVIQQGDSGFLLLGTNLLSPDGAIQDAAGHIVATGFVQPVTSGVAVSAPVATPAPRSVLKLQNLDAKTLRISIHGTANTTHIIEACNGLATGDWHMVGSAMSDETGNASYDITKPESGGIQFFRTWNSASAEGPPR
jgi:hypothetical protein